MTEAATVWPGQEVVAPPQWPGQEVTTAQQGEHGYAPAPPKPETAPPVVGWNPVGDELGNIYTPSPPPSLGDMRDAVAPPPTNWLPDWLAKGPAWLPDSLSKPPTSKLDFGKIAGAMQEGWRGPVSLLPPGSDEAGQESLWGPIMGGAINTLARIPLGIPNALTYGTAEYANQASGDPRLGRDVNLGAQVMATLFPLRGRIPSPLEMTVAPRVNPNMKGFTEQTAALREADEAARRYGPPEASIRAPESSEPPAPAVNAGVEAVRAQLGLRDAPQPTPDMTATPADRAPAFAPRTVTDPLTNEVTQTQVPMDLRLRAAINAVPDEQAPAFAAPGDRPPPVAPGAAGPATLPPYTEPVPGRGSPNQGADTRAAPLMEGFNQAAPPPVPPGAPVPGNAGAAATPNTAFGRSAREIKGQQADMELADLMRTPQPGDARDIIPGAAQTKAEIELSPDVSREAKGLRQEFREGFNDHEKANNELYHRHIDDVVPPREDIATMKDVREARWQDAEKTVFGDNPNGEPVSTASVVDHINSVLADPKEKFNSYLRKAFQPFLDALTDESGKPITLGAKELYGLRAEMARARSRIWPPIPISRIRGQFGDLLNKTDEAITRGAPSYRTMMDNYTADSGPINAAERLADMKLKVTNGSDRVITFGAMDRYMKSLWMERHGPNPYALAKSIPQATWDHLMQLHERLARSASADELARTKGSDTTQLLMEMARKGAIGAAHLLAAKVAPGLGNLAVPYITKQIDTRISQKRVGQHLNPDVSQYPPTTP